MSWKSIVITGLLCVVASPVLAQEPTITFADGGLDGGNQIWDVSIAPNPTGFVVDSSMAVELDLTFTSAVTNFALNGAFWNVGAVSNPGNNPFTQTMTETVIDGSTLFIAAGSELFADTNAVLLGSITTTGVGGTVEWGGLDTGAGFMSTRIAQQSTNYNGLTGEFTIPGGGLKGDTNDDGVVNGFDIDPFVLVLTDLPSYQAMFPGVDGVDRADVNSDTVANGFDIDPFVVCVTNGGCAPGAGSLAASAAGGVAAVPEPASLLLCFGAAAFVALRRRGR